MLVPGLRKVQVVLGNLMVSLLASAVTVPRFNQIRAA